MCFSFLYLSNLKLWYESSSHILRNYLLHLHWITLLLVQKDKSKQEHREDNGGLSFVTPMCYTKLSRLLFSSSWNILLMIILAFAWYLFMIYQHVVSLEKYDHKCHNGMFGNLESIFKCWISPNTIFGKSWIWKCGIGSIA